MKCSKIELASRKELKIQRKSVNENQTAQFQTQEHHSYSFPHLLKRKSASSHTLSITTIKPSSDFKSFNTGSSLEKWSKKRPRLKSAKSRNRSADNESDDKDFCYETLKTDLTLLLDDPDNEFGDNLSFDGSLSNLQYEIHTDIEELILKTQRSKNEESGNNKNKNKKKKNKNKTIKFSISRPPSPQTEQIIRVDVVSTVTVTNNEKDNRKVEMKKREIVNGEELQFNREIAVCDEDFIVRCRKLALRNRRKRL